VTSITSIIGITRLGDGHGFGRGFLLASQLEEFRGEITCLIGGEKMLDFDENLLLTKNWFCFLGGSKSGKGFL